MVVVIQDKTTEEMIEKIRERLNLKTKADAVRYAVKQVYDEMLTGTSYLTKE